MVLRLRKTQQETVTMLTISATETGRLQQWCWDTRGNHAYNPMASVLTIEHRLATLSFVLVTRRLFSAVLNALGASQVACAPPIVLELHVDIRRRCRACMNLHL